MTKEKIEQNLVLKLSFEFAILAIEYCEKLVAEKKFVIAKQLLKSGTSVGANAMEAQNAESKADFIHKFKIAAKEAKKPSIGYSFATIQSIIPNAKIYYLKLMR